jgi:hypothetical protein
VVVARIISDGGVVPPQADRNKDNDNSRSTRVESLRTSVLLS